MTGIFGLTDEDFDDLFRSRPNGAALRAIREWCDRQKSCAIGKGCVRCAVRAQLVEEVRALLPPVPEVAEEVEMEDATFTRRDREYPGGTKPSN